MFIAFVILGAGLVGYIGGRCARSDVSGRADLVSARLLVGQIRSDLAALPRLVEAPRSLSEARSQSLV